MAMAMRVAGKEEAKGGKVMAICNGDKGGGEQPQWQQTGQWQRR
jgi:hypothetical protein